MDGKDTPRRRAFSRWQWPVVALLALLVLGISGNVLTADDLYVIYLPHAERPIPTPTATPVPTPTPRLMFVCIDGSCSSFRGGSADDPNGEYVCFRNCDSAAIDMTGWRVLDQAGHTYVFPPFVLPQGAIVRLYSGPGRNTHDELHWARGLVWNNSHDTVYLYDAVGREVDRYVY